MVNKSVLASRILDSAGSSQAVPRMFYQVPCIVRNGLFAGEIPENSLLSFRQAKRAGYGLHVPVRITKDKELVIHEDATVRRMTGVSRKLSELSYRETRQLRLNGSGEQIPLLEELLESSAGLPICLELKEPGIELRVAELLEMYRYAHEHVLLCSWWFRGINTLSEVAPHIARCRAFGRSLNLSWLQKICTPQANGEVPIKSWKERFPAVLLQDDYFGEQEISMFRANGFEVIVSNAQSVRSMQTSTMAEAGVIQMYTGGVG